MEMMNSAGIICSDFFEIINGGEKEVETDQPQEEQDDSAHEKQFYN